MDYFDTINQDIEMINDKLNMLIEFWENKLNKGSKKTSSEALRLHLNQIINEIEIIEYFKNSLAELDERINFIVENEISTVNLDQLRYVSIMITKLRIVYEKPASQESLIKLTLKIVNKMKSDTTIEIVEEIPIEELYDLKIAILVKYIINKIVKDDKLSINDINNLTNDHWCKSILKVNYPLLKLYKEKEEINDQRKIEGVVKYYTETIYIRGQRYFLCRDLHERSKQMLINWYGVKYNYFPEDIYTFEVSSEDLKPKTQFSISNYDHDKEYDIEESSLQDPFKILNWLDRNS
jgi:hypothetical protein